MAQHGSVIPLIVAAGVLAPGCSVHEALDTQPTPNLRAVYMGAPRADIEAVLGTPVESMPVAGGGTLATYEYHEGDGFHIGRALGHIGLDIATLGLWEAVGQSVENSAVTRYRLPVEYNIEDVASNVRPPIAIAPAE